MMETEVLMVAIMALLEVIAVPLEIQIMGKTLVLVEHTMVILLRINLLVHHLTNLIPAVLHQLSVDLAAVVPLIQEAEPAVQVVLTLEAVTEVSEVAAVTADPEEVVTDKKIYFHQEFNLGM